MVDPRLLTRAAGPGRIRDTALRLFTAALESPRQARSIVSKGLREARYLHSHERRLVGDGIYDLFRHRLALAARVGDDPLHLWLMYLITLGLPEAEALEQAELDIQPATDDPQLLSGLDPDIYQMLDAQLGDALPGFIEASNKRAPIVLRVHGRRDALLRELISSGIVTEPHPLAEKALVVEDRENIRGTRAWGRGRILIQDIGSQLIVDLLEPYDGPVVDLCAGAGGKSLQLLDRGAEVISADIRKSALDEFRKRAKRGKREVTTVVIDPEGPLPDAIPTTKRMLVDAPCTGLGTLRRSPHHRLWVDAAAVAELTALQRQILDRAAAKIAPGGRLVYATCSVLDAENDDVIAAFLADHDDFSVLPASEILGEERANAIGDGTAIRVRPDTHGTDGFYAIALVRE